LAKARDYKAEYAKRLARGQAKGQTRQQARGHVEHEHVQRREREIEEFGLSSQQVRSIRDWCARYDNKDRDAEDVIEQARDLGYGWFQNYRNVWNEARRNYLRQQRTGEWISGGEGFLFYLQNLADAPEPSWLYYH
jgi:hypothetical protein